MSTSQITLQGLAVTSLLASLFIIIFLPLRSLLRRVIGSQWLCVLWLALLMRLLIPLPLESRWSLFNRWQSSTVPAVAVDEPVTIKVSAPENTATSHKPTAANIPAAKAPAPSRPALSPVGALKILWLGGLGTGLCLLAWRSRQTHRLAAETRPATDERLLQIYASIPQKLRRSVLLRTTGALQVPTLAGVIHPQIWMPESWPGKFSDDELRNVLLHELGHARRRDLLVQWLFALAQCLHWFNPLVWLAARAARFDREMACDAWVLARRGADHAGYGAALMKTVQLLRGPLHATPATVAMASSRRSLYTRISGIGAFRRTPAWRGVAGIALMIAALATVTTSCKKAESTQSPAIPPVAAPDSAPGKQEITIETKFVSITEDEWKKFCAGDPAFKDFKSKFPELDHEKTAYADLPDKLIQQEKGSWEIPEGAISQLSVLSGEDFARMIRTFNESRGADLLSSPSVTTRDKQRAVVEVIREFRYPTDFQDDKNATPRFTPTAFTTKNVGVTLEIRPELDKDGAIGLEIVPSIVSFIGFVAEKDGKKILAPGLHDASTSPNYPVFATSSGRITPTIQPGQTVLMGSVRLDNEKTTTMDQITSSDTAMTPPADATPETGRQILLVFVTAKEAPAPPKVQEATGEIKIESHITAIPEEIWKKLCPQNSQPAPIPGVYIVGGRNGNVPFDFKNLSPEFPELDAEKPSYAELAQKLTSQPAEKEVNAGMRLMGVLTESQFKAMVKILASTDGCQLLATPTMITKSGQEASVIMGQPGKNDGFTLKTKPTLSEDKQSIDLDFDNESSTLLGFLGNDGKKFAPAGGEDSLTAPTPVFSKAAGKTSVSVENNQSVVFAFVQLKVVPGEDGAAPGTVRTVFLVSFTLRIVDAADKSNGEPAAAASPSPAPLPSNSDLPYARPVPEKPGFVASPYAPDAGVIDVQGFPPGTEVKDPYTGKTFLVP